MAVVRARYDRAAPERRMKRRPLNLVAALSLLAVALILAAWARSYAPRDFTAGANNGSLLLLFTDGQWTSYARPRENFTLAFDDLWRLARGAATGKGSFLGVSYVSRPTQAGARPGGHEGRFFLVAVPFAYPLALAAAAAAWALAARARLARRSRLGACKSCGYDLTGNVSGTCPECGKAAA